MVVVEMDNSALIAEGPSWLLPDLRLSLERYFDEQLVIGDEHFNLKFASKH